VADGEADFSRDDDPWVVVVVSKPGIVSDEVELEVAVEKVVGVVMSSVLSVVIAWVALVVSSVVVCFALVIVGLVSVVGFGLTSAVVVSFSVEEGRECPTGTPTP
jgi:hypothetical protein